MQERTKFQEAVDTDISPQIVREYQRSIHKEALQASRSEDANIRLSAVRVAGLLASNFASSILSAAVLDADERVSGFAFNLLVGLGQDGVFGLRKAAGGKDPKLAATALDLLADAQENGSVPVAARCLAHPDPCVRLEAVRLIGVCGGIGKRRLVEALLKDEKKEVVAFAEQALRRMLGEEEKPVRQSWYHGEGITVSGLPPFSEGIPERPPTPVVPVPVLRHPSAAPLALAPLPTSQADAAVVAGEEPSEMDQEVPDEPLPQSAVGWAILLAKGGREEDCLQHLNADLGQAAAKYRSGQTRHLAIGVARAAVALNRQSALSIVRRMVSDPDATVRVEALKAMAQLGSASVLPILQGAVNDSSDEVCQQAMAAVATLGRRLERVDLAVRSLKSLRVSGDERQKWLKDTLEELV